jgi:hypothetical protein
MHPLAQRADSYSQPLCDCNSATSAKLQPFLLVHIFSVAADVLGQFEHERIEGDRDLSAGEDEVVRLPRRAETDGMPAKTKENSPICAGEAAINIPDVNVCGEMTVIACVARARRRRGGEDEFGRAAWCVEGCRRSRGGVS